MSDGNFFEVEDAIYLQIGELQDCPEAPFVSLERWSDDSNLYCQEALGRFFIPKDWVKELPPDYYCVNLTLRSFSFLDKNIFNELKPADTLRRAQIQIIKDCAKKICGPSKKIMKFF